MILRENIWQWIFCPVFPVMNYGFSQSQKLVRYHMHVMYITEGLPFGNAGKMKQETDSSEVALLGPLWTGLAGQIAIRNMSQR